MWGTWLLEELAEHGHRLSPGTLYPALARMLDNEWIRQTNDVSHAKARRMYRATARGKKLLERLREDLRELYEEVVLGHEPGAREKQEGVARIQPTSKKGRRT